jgi:hypothetical protein
MRSIQLNVANCGSRWSTSVQDVRRQATSHGRRVLIVEPTLPDCRRCANVLECEPPVPGGEAHLPSDRTSVVELAGEVPSNDVEDLGPFDHLTVGRGAGPDSRFSAASGWRLEA